MVNRSLQAKRIIWQLHRFFFFFFLLALYVSQRKLVPSTNQKIVYNFGTEWFTAKILFYCRSSIWDASVHQIWIPKLCFGCENRSFRNHFGVYWKFIKFKNTKIIFFSSLHTKFCQVTKLANFYRLVRVPAWLWNLEFCTKIGIQKSRCHFLRVWRHKKRFAVISACFFALSDRFSHFWHVFRQFCDQADIH